MKAAIVSFLQPNPERIEGEFDAQRSEWVYMPRRTPVVRLGWSAVIGDILSNYRSALDYIAAQLVLSGGGQVTNRTAFPIIDSPTANWPSTSHERLGGAPSSAIDIIKLMQPYQPGNGGQLNALSLLRDLNNWDKHEALHTTVHVALVSWWAISYSYRGVQTVGTETIHSGPLKAGEPVGTWGLVSERGQQPEVNRPLIVTYDIAFEGGPPSTRGRSVIEVLTDIALAVDETVPQFEKFF
jgi:hypothetical protein